MPYIDSDYYLNSYKGKPYSDPDELARAIERASDAIDMVTMNKLNIDESLITSHLFIEAQVKKATASIVEFYKVNGGYETTIESNESQVKLGSFSYSTSKGESIQIPKIAINHLSQTGLLYAGIDREVEHFEY